MVHSQHDNHQQEKKQRLGRVIWGSLGGDIAHFQTEAPRGLKRATSSSDPATSNTKPAPSVSRESRTVTSVPDSQTATLNLLGIGGTATWLRVQIVESPALLAGALSMDPPPLFAAPSYCANGMIPCVQ